MKKIIIDSIMIIMCFVLQTTVLRYIAIAGICPNLIVILPVLFGFLGDEREGIYTGFACGIVFDAFYADVLGVNAFIFMMFGYAAGLLGRMFTKSEMIVPVLLIICADFCYGIVNYAIYFLVHRRFDMGYYLNKIIMPELVYTVFMSIIIYRLLLIGHSDKKVVSKKERTINKYVI